MSMHSYVVEVRFSDGTVAKMCGIFPSDCAAILAGLALPGDPHRAVVPRRRCA